MDEGTELQPLLNVNEAQRSPWKEITKCVLILLPLIFFSSWKQEVKTVSKQLIFKRFQGPNGTHANHSYPVNISCLEQDQSAANKIESESSMFILYMDICACSVSFIFIPFWGVISDKHGRSIVMVACGIGALVKISALLAVAHFDSVPIWILIISEAFHNIFGNYRCFVMASTAFISDSIKSKFRTSVLILYEFMQLGVRTMLQYTIGKLLFKLGFTTVLVCSLASNVMLILYVIAIFSRCIKQNIEPYHEPIWPQLKHCFTQTVKTFSQQRYGFTRMALFLITLSMMLDYTARYGIDTVFTIYSLGPPLCWTSETIGKYHAVSSASSAFFSLFGSLALLKFKVNGRLMALGIVSNILAFITTGLSKSSSEIFIGGVIGGLHILVPAISSSIVCDLVSPDEIGVALGGFVSVGAFASLLGHAFFNSIYAATLSFFKPLCFILASAIDVLAIVLMGAYGICRYKTIKMANEENQS